MSEGVASLYRELVLEHAQTPRNRRRIEDPSIAQRGANTQCGDEIELSLRLEGDRIIDIAFEGQGCAISQASASMLTDLLRGCTLDDAAAIEAAIKRMLSGDGTVDAELLGDAEALHDVRHFPRRVSCAALAWTTLHEALVDRRAKEAGRPAV